MAAFADFFEAEGDGLPVAQLKSKYVSLRGSFADLPTAATKPAMLDALREFEASHPKLCTMLPSKDEFYGVSKGSNLLQKYIQWVFIPAVKDASSEQVEAKKTAFGLLLERTVRSKMSFEDQLAALREDTEKQFQKLLDDNRGALKELSTSLSTRLKEWAHPGAELSLAWRNDPSRNISVSEPLAEVLVGEGRFQGTPTRFGHGLKRSFLLALLQELSGCPDSGNPRLLLACEEPELYQHPPQARHLSSVLQKLSRSNSQIIISTHSPYFVSGKGFEDVRVIRHDAVEDQPVVKNVSFDELSEKLAAALGTSPGVPAGVEFNVEQSLQVGLNEMFFSPVLILVEGPEDLGYISAYFTLTERMDEFRRLGCHIVPTLGKSNMIRPLAIATLLEIPTFVVFDADGQNATKPEKRPQHERDNVAPLRLCSVHKPEPFPAGIFSTSNLVIWPTKIGDAIKGEFGKTEWEGFETAVRKKRDILDVSGLEKNVI